MGVCLLSLPVHDVLTSAPPVSPYQGTKAVWDIPQPGGQLHPTSSSRNMWCHNKDAMHRAPTNRNDLQRAKSNRDDKRRAPSNRDATHRASSNRFDLQRATANRELPGPSEEGSGTASQAPGRDLEVLARAGLGLQARACTNGSVELSVLLALSVSSIH